MKKKTINRKLTLNRTTISNLMSPAEMNAGKAGGFPSDVGASCFTNKCCKSVKYICD